MDSSLPFHFETTLQSKGYQFIEYINIGCYSHICKVCKDNQLFAAKIIQYSSENDDEDMMFNNLLLQQEKWIMKRINHPNCIKIIEKIKCDNGSYIFIIPLAVNNLNTFINIFYKANPFWFVNKSSFQHMSEHLIKYLYNQMIEALHYLQMQHIVHFDIKPENILYFNNFQLKLTDFNLSSRVKCSNQGEKYELLNMGTKGYMGIEMYSQNIKQISAAECHKVDLFALGCILYRLVYDKRVIETIETDEFKVKKEIDKAIAYLNNNTVYQPSNQLRDIIRELLQPINMRPTLNQLMLDKWRFQDKDKIDNILQINESYDDKLIIELQKSCYFRKVSRYNIKPHKNYPLNIFHHIVI